MQKDTSPLNKPEQSITKQSIAVAVNATKFRIATTSVSVTSCTRNFSRPVCQKEPNNPTASDLLAGIRTTTTLLYYYYSLYLSNSQWAGGFLSFFCFRHALYACRNDWQVQIGESMQKFMELQSLVLSSWQALAGIWKQAGFPQARAANTLL